MEVKNDRARNMLVKPQNSAKFDLLKVWQSMSSVRVLDWVSRGEGRMERMART